jgi:hypothetical protein
MFKDENKITVDENKQNFKRRTTSENMAHDLCTVIMCNDHNTNRYDCN